MPDTPVPTSFPPEVLVAYLRERHIPCPVCRQDLHQLSTPRCPQCHQDLFLGLAATEAYRAAWGVLLTALFMCSAVGLLLASLLVRFQTLPRTSLLPGFALFIVSIPLPVWPLVARRRFFRLTTSTQWILAALSILYCLTAFGLLFLDDR